MPRHGPGAAVGVGLQVVCLLPICRTPPLASPAPDRKGVDEVPSLLVRGALFTSSYAPLLLLFALLDSLGRGWPSTA